MDERTQARVEAIKTEWPEVFQAIFDAGRGAGGQAGQSLPGAQPTPIPKPPTVSASAEPAGVNTEKEIKRTALVAAAAKAANRGKVAGRIGGPSIKETAPDGPKPQSRELVSQAIAAGNRLAAKRSRK